MEVALYILGGLGILALCAIAVGWYLDGRTMPEWPTEPTDIPENQRAKPQTKPDNHGCHDCGCSKHRKDLPR